MPYELITRLLDFPDFRLVDIETEERSVALTLERKEMTFRSGSCGKGLLNKIGGNGPRFANEPNLPTSRQTP